MNYIDTDSFFYRSVSLTLLLLLPPPLKSAVNKSLIHLRFANYDCKSSRKLAFCKPFVVANHFSTSCPSGQDQGHCYPVTVSKNAACLQQCSLLVKAPGTQAREWKMGTNKTSETNLAQRQVQLSKQ